MIGWTDVVYRKIMNQMHNFVKISLLNEKRKKVDKNLIFNEVSDSKVKSQKKTKQRQNFVKTQRKQIKSQENKN